MVEILEVTAPFFALILCGYLAAQLFRLAPLEIATLTLSWLLGAWAAAPIK